ncbi:MAG TPA: hypothetical protein VGM67_02510 [Gemmatimonadaceae bacterium]
MGGLIACTELLLRILPVERPPILRATSDSNPVALFEPNLPFVHSQGALLTDVVRNRTNNYGFVSGIDYSASDTSPLCAVVGDSYIQGLTVPPESSFYGRLRQQLGDRARVYNFGAGGASFPQYLVLSDFARRAFHPSGLIVAVIERDALESWEQFNTAAGQYRFVLDGDSVVMHRRDYVPGRARGIIAASALLRYMILNVQLTPVFSAAVAELRHTLLDRWRHPFVPSHGAVNAPASDTVGEALSRLAVDEFLRRLPQASGLPPRQIVLLFDAHQRYPSETAATTDREARIRRYSIDAAQRLGYGIVDMQPAFLSEFARDHRRFEFATDRHWTAYGHAAVFRELAKQPLIQRACASW